MEYIGTTLAAVVLIVVFYGVLFFVVVPFASFLFEKYLVWVRGSNDSEGWVRGGVVMGFVAATILYGAAALWWHSSAVCF